MASKAPTLPWWSFRAHIKRALSTLDHSHTVDVQPGAGLMQLSSSSLLNISVPCLIKALGNNYMSSVAGFIRRWRAGLASVGPSNFGHHVVVPSWGSEDWVCSGCSRHANFTRDPTLFGLLSLVRRLTMPVVLIALLLVICLMCSFFLSND